MIIFYLLKLLIILPLILFIGRMVQLLKTDQNVCFRFYVFLTVELFSFTITPLLMLMSKRTDNLLVSCGILMAAVIMIFYALSRVIVCGNRLCLIRFRIIKKKDIKRVAGSYLYIKLETGERTFKMLNPIICNDFYEYCKHFSERKNKKNEKA